LRAQAALSLVDRARALPEATLDDTRTVASPLHRRRFLAVGALSAGVAVAATAGLLAMADKPQTFRTARGELRRVALEDGSVAEINTETSLDVTMARRIRRVRLQHGEALFTVVKDSARPFVVETSNIRVGAVETAFSVYDAGTHIDVLVTEGVVEAWRRMDRATRVRIGAGSRLRIGHDGAFVVSEAVDGIARDLAWRSGQIDLAGRSLAQAVAEFNRYNQRRIVIDDPALGGETLIGLFRTNDPESFARSIALAFGASLSQTTDTIRLGPPTP
jgi:transmembrane sensor